MIETEYQNQYKGKAQILVGTLYAGEPQFDDCLQSVRQQEAIDFDHFVIRNKRKNEAHDLLFGEFGRANDCYDYFFKLDADMVLESPEFLVKTIDYCAKNNIDWLTIWVYDHVQETFINGAHFFGQKVKFKKTEDNFFTDRSVSNECQLNREYLKKPSELIHHCPNPTNYQLFNFGIHRAIKFFQYGRKNKIKNAHHWKVLTNALKGKNWYSFKKKSYVVWSFYLVFVGRLSGNIINHASLEKQKLFKEVTGRVQSQVRTPWLFELIGLFPRIGYYTFRYLIIPIQEKFKPVKSKEKY